MAKDRVFVHNYPMQVALLIRANQGDKIAYQELLSELLAHTLKQLRRGLYQYKNFPPQAFDDIAQEVLITFHQTHQTFDTTRPLTPWVNTMIKYKMIDFLRKKDFTVQMNGVDIDTFKEIWSIDEESEALDENEFVKLLEKLSPQQVQVLKLAKLEGFSSKEIATKLNLSDSNVKVIIHRAMKELKTL